MNAQVQHELESAITSQLPLEEIVALLRRYKDQGITQGEVYSFLQTWHRANPEEATDDRILDRGRNANGRLDR